MTNSTGVLSMCFGSLRLRCHGATAKSLADELGMEPGDLLLSDAATGESIVIPFKQRDSLSAMIGLPLGVRSAPGGDSSCG